MEAIRNYLDGLFIKMPDTKEIREAKASMEREMEARYRELKEQGKTESEAIGMVFSEYASLDAQKKESAPNTNPYQSAPKKKESETKKTSGNRVLDSFMSVFWLTITCIYLCWSFLTYDWYITWIIWPIAAVVKGMIEGIFFDKEEK